ncbi:Glycosyltransferase involved in cell wall bisynthesis [Sinomicrobium oceani]|uniref:Glycosyltransferase involved in cell wall bisynthesis n=1 Tax=Sinomicrobium oceani TaxID=1150368 RepID=A0A1K1R017_9FLAO|nr:glycosyltransferase [Sinomicrobium oceani]SFW65276.1 Glycosyltransferase involved in cell wall bisynthesis [Sinomicrobium oceani]
MKSKICLVYNYAQHYRLGIFKLLDKELGCHFYFGDKLMDIKKINYKELPHFKKELKNIVILRPIYWQKGILPIFFKNYKHYILLGEYFCLSTWLILLLSKFTNKKTYLWTHGWYGNEGVLKRVIKKVFLGLGDEILLYGNYAKELLINNGMAAQKLTVIYNSLDYNKQKEIRENFKPTDIFKKKFNNNNPTLIFIGRLTKVKKLHLLIKAHHYLESKGCNCNLVLIGEGEDKTQLIELSKEKNTHNSTWFYGPCYDEEKIGELLGNASICVSPGNVGLTAIHSLMYGTPVITHSGFKSQMPEFESIMPGKTGAFFEEDDIQSLEDTIVKWFNVKNNREKVRQECYSVIDLYYNPYYQCQMIKQVIDKNDKR